MELPKILHLVLYSLNDNDYNNMYNITSSFYKKIPNVTTYYYCYNNNIDTEYKLDGDILYIKGNESYLPGILEKTIKAFKYFEKEEYDYVIRTNISSIINFKNLSFVLKEYPINYGGKLECLQWIDEKGGIIDTTYWGTTYAQGICIILSSSTYHYLLNTELNYNVIDDVSIGLALKNVYFINITNYVHNGNYSEYTIIYRNKTDSNRNKDVEHMKVIIEQMVLELF
jgi:hypothetical protein